MVLAHLAVCISDQFMTVIEFHFIAGIRKYFQNLARHLNEIFLCHIFPSFGEQSAVAGHSAV